MRRVLLVLLGACTALMLCWPIMAQTVPSMSGGGGSTTIVVGTTTLTGGTNTRVLFDDSGVIGESSGLTYVKATGALTSTISVAVVNWSLNDNTSASPGGYWSTEQTPDAPILMTGTASNSWILAERADVTFDFAHAAATDPTLWIQSHNQSTTQALSLAHNGTTGVIAANGGVAISTASLFSTAVATDNSTNFLTITGTMPAVPTASVYGVDISATGAGSAAQFIGAFRAGLLAGYTGSNGDAAAVYRNTTAGTGTNPFAGGGNVSNFGGYSTVTSTTTGTNVGMYGYAQTGNANYGVFGEASATKNSATNIGVAGFAANGGTTPIRVGGFFGLMSSTPTYVDSALIADNGAIAAPIAIFRDNGTAVFTIADGGPVTITSTIVSSRTTDIGWSVVAGANTACNTTCTNACVFGEDTAVVGTIVACTDASADLCVCAGAN